ncbi:hypothetical protein [Micromonospora sp. NPDC049679]|uniref:hypothetical protein n=1 Tax=Micromonospora sp. NPDC049679 TaxID=3155920 RepID=UPI00340E4C4C
MDSNYPDHPEHPTTRQPNKALLARAWCHRHANLYLSRAPLNGYTARFALEPVVNLARLRIRAGDGDGAHNLLTDLYNAIISGRPVVVDELELHPRQLPADTGELDQNLGRLRSVLLSDGTRALTLAGRWADALTHVRYYDGIGPTLLDGRQVAVVAHLTQGDSPASAAILRHTQIAQPWEQAVYDLLQNWHATTVGDLPPTDHTDLIERLPGIPSTAGLRVFRIRLSLTALDLATDVSPTLAKDLVNRLISDVIRDEDANPARDLLGHPAVDREHHRALRQLVEASGLGLGYLPDAAHKLLSSALDLADAAIHPR